MTFGILVNCLKSELDYSLMSGIKEAAADYKINLLYFIGKSVKPFDSYHQYHKIIYQLPATVKLDHLIVFSGVVLYQNDTEMRNFLQQFKNVPILTLGFRLDSCPALCLDNKAGFRELVRHMLVDHVKKRPVFVGGPTHNYDAMERFSVYKEMLEQNNINLDERLIVDNMSFVREAGIQAANILLDQRQLLPGRDFDAVIAANDAMAVGMMDALLMRGYRIPADVVFSGFDDIDLGKYHSVPLTTVRPDMHWLGKEAIRFIFRCISHPEENFSCVPTRLIIRRSCGCDTAKSRLQDATTTDPAGETVPENWRQVRLELFEQSEHLDKQRIITNEISTKQDMNEILPLLRTGLSTLGFGRYYLFLYTSPGGYTRDFRLILACSENEPGEAGAGSLYPDFQAVCDRLLQRSVPSSWCILPLIEHTDIFGFLVMETIDNINARIAYENISSMISNAMRRTGLLNETRKANNLLKEANAQKTQFFINVAHETKTPLTLIRNYLELYMEEHPPDEKLLVIRQNIDLLLAHMLNFLDAERLRKGDIIYNHNALTDLSLSARRKYQLFRGVALQKKIRIKQAIEPNVLIRIDPCALDRIFNNLLDNAVKYTGPGGQVELAVTSRDGQAILRVSDNGPGLPVDAREHIFEPYYLLSVKKTGQQGIGVGLSIVKGIVDSLGAAIAVTGQKGEGTCFTITFRECVTAQSGETLSVAPAAFPLPLVNINIRETDITPDKISLLVVDDNLPLLKFMQQILAPEYNVFLARDVPEAIAKLKTIPRPAVIISDIMMAGPDGFQFLADLSLMENYKEIPFIFLTAMGGEKERIMGLKLGAVDYIEKPFSAAELKARIDSLIGLCRRQGKRDISRIRDQIEKVLSDYQEGMQYSPTASFDTTCATCRITEHQKEIIRLMLSGLIHKEIAAHLHMPLRTLENHITGIYRKCGVNTKYDLLAKFRKS